MNWFQVMEYFAVIVGSFFKYILFSLGFKLEIYIWVRMRSPYCTSLFGAYAESVRQIILIPELIGVFCPIGRLVKLDTIHRHIMVKAVRLCIRPVWLRYHLAFHDGAPFGTEDAGVYLHAVAHIETKGDRFSRAGSYGPGWCPVSYTHLTLPTI